MISKTLTYLTFVLLLSFVLIGSARAQQSKLPPCPNVAVEKYNNCFGTWSDGNGDKYVGEWKDGHNYGQGTYTWANGDKYVGENRNDQANGQGTMTYANGNKYAGKFKDGKRSSQGTMIFANGTKYVGEFKDGKRNGTGTYTWPNGETYVGEFKDDTWVGQGTMTYANGNKYVGEFKDGKRNGQGTMTFPDGTVFVGKFKDGLANGQGTGTSPSGHKYVGEFKDGLKNGQGTKTFDNGDKYVGAFKDGKQNGQGILYAASGSIIEQGVYENGVLTKSETVLPQASTNAHRVQMVKEGGTYTVPVLINDVLPLHFVVDSGAADVTIPADVAMTLMRTGTITESDFIGSQKYQLADGSVIDSKQFIIRSLKVGDQTVENVLGSIGDAKGSLLLGQSFLEKFKSWSMDNASHELVLECLCR